MSNWRRTHQSGFTLVEVMVSTAILSIGIYMVAGYFIQTSMTNRQSKIRTNLVTLRNNFVALIQTNSSWNATLDRASGSISPSYPTSSRGIASTGGGMMGGAGPTPTGVTSSSATFGAGIGCWKSGQDCQGVSYPIKFTPVRANGEPYKGYDPQVSPNVGFNLDGEACYTFNLDNPDPNCPFRFEFSWLPNCPAGLTCYQPPSTVEIRFLTTSSDAGRAGPRLNPLNFSTTLYLPGRSIALAGAIRCPQYQMIDIVNLQNTGSLDCVNFCDVINDSRCP